MLRHSGLAQTLRLLWRLKLAAVLALLLLAIVVCAVLAPYIAPHDPLETDITARLLPPQWLEGGSTEHVLGTDQIGRDILSRIIFGARVSLLVGMLAVFLSLLIGLP